MYKEMPPVRPLFADVRTLLKFFVVFLAGLQVFAGALSVGGIQLTRYRAVIVMLAAGAIAALISRHALERAEDEPSTHAPVLSGRLCRYLLAATVAIVGVLLFVGYCTGDLSFDGNSYHLPTINQWATKGFIHDVDPAFGGSEFMNGYPKGSEAVTFVIVKAFGSGVANFLNLFYAPLGVLGVAVLCQMLGATALESMVFGSAYLLVPANLNQYSSTYVDAAFGAAVVALLALLADNLRSAVHVSRRRVWLLDAVVIGCAVGNVIAVKGSGLVVAPMAIACFVVFALGRREGLFTRLRQVFSVISVALVVAAVVGGGWYVKNYVRHGSPLYPIGLSVLGHPIWPGETPAQAIDEVKNTPPEMRTIRPVRRIAISWIAPLVSWPWTYARPGVADQRLGALGALWILGCVPAVLVCVWFLARGGRDDSGRRVTYGFLGSSILLSFCGTPMNWWGRYTVWIFALGLPSMWLVLSMVEKRGPGLRRWVRSWSSVCAGLLIIRAAMIMLVGCLYLMYDVGRGGSGIPTSKVRREARLLPIFPEMRSPVLAQMLRTETAVGVGPRDLEGWSAAVYGQLVVPIGKRNLIPVPADVTEPEVQGLCSSTHLNYILWQTSSPIPSSLARNVIVRGSEGPFTYLEISRSSASE